MANATLFRYKTETFVENNPNLYNSLMYMADAYNTAALSKDIAIALGSAAMGNPAVACGFLAKYALFAGVEQLALWVCEHGAENLARYCAEGDAAIYTSYLKTLDFVVDFAVKHGVCGALNKKLATANGYSARQFNLNKPHEFRSGKTSGGVKYRKVTGHKERVVSTPQMQADFIQRMKTERDWRLKGKINNQHAYYCAKDGLYYVPVRGEKNDIEVWRVSGKRAVHQGAIECNTGRLYEGPKHKDAKFE